MNGGMTEGTQHYLALVDQVPPPMEDYKLPFPIKGSVYDYRLDIQVSFIEAVCLICQYAFLPVASLFCFI